MKYSKEEERQAQAKRDQAVQIDKAKQIQDIDDMLVKKGVAQKLPEPIATQQGI
ncbi:hypothetical protein [Pseudomonas simiae]|nr:hypothetical protein [Pseudomonas simiae]MCF5338411.1 hypothetical protein [Pseudomonas simiae]